MVVSMVVTWWIVGFFCILYLPKDPPSAPPAAPAPPPDTPCEVEGRSNEADLRGWGFLGVHVGGGGGGGFGGLVVLLKTTTLSPTCKKIIKQTYSSKTAPEFNLSFKQKSCDKTFVRCQNLPKGGGCHFSVLEWFSNEEERIQLILGQKHVAQVILFKFKWAWQVRQSGQQYSCDMQFSGCNTLLSIELPCFSVCV